MSSVQCLRQFFNERLSVAAEEIFKVFEKAFVDYEEEISRQRKLLDTVWKPDVKLHRIELPREYICKEEEILADQQLCNQESNSGLDQQDPEPPQIKEEQEELYTRQDEEQLELKQAADAYIQTFTYEKGHQSEDQTLYLNPDETQSAADKESINNILAKSSEVPEPNTDHQLLPHISHLAESQHHRGHKHGDSVLKAETKPRKRPHKSKSVHNFTMLKNSCNTHKGQKCLKCETCGNTFKDRTKLNTHMRLHRGLKAYSCNICGKRFNLTSVLNIHKKSHTGKKTLSCHICGKRFGQVTVFKIHKRIHTGEKPYCCTICGKRFAQATALKVHKRVHKTYSCNVCGKRFSRTSGLNSHLTIHTGAKPYSCKTCGKCLRSRNGLLIHMRTHTGEKPYPCNTCGKSFKDLSVLKRHSRRHTGEKPHLCIACGKRFYESSDLKRHIRIHTGESPYACGTCGRRFSQLSDLKRHTKIHTDEKLYSCETVGNNSDLVVVCEPTAETVLVSDYVRVTVDECNQGC